MKKIFIFLGVVILLMAVGVFAASDELMPEVKENIGVVLENVAEAGLGAEVQGYVEDFVEKRGIEPDAILNVSKVKLDDLEDDVHIANIDDTNIQILKVDYDDDAGEAVNEEQLYVITYSTTELKNQGDLIIAHDKRQFLNFGSVGEMSSGFLETATGVEGSLETGYVMMRPGSITGISTSLDVIGASDGNVEIIVYKNGEAIRFGNAIDATSTGVKKDHDVQSNDVVNFEPGDVISAYATSSSTYKSVITMVEVTTSN